MNPIVIALGGNAIVQKGDSGALATQEKRIVAALRPLVPLIKKHPVVLTHGNGPAVGRLLLLQKNQKIRMPLDVLDAQTEGSIGYLLQQHLCNLLKRKKDVATVLTQALVDKNDPAFKQPTKFVGPFYTETQARTLRKQFPLKKDANRGYRRVVPSPKPLAIIETRTIEALLQQHMVVIAAGGGGIPVIKTKKGLDGVEAVVDKDRASACLANALNAQTLIIVTSVPGVYTRFGTREQRLITRMHVEDARMYLYAGQFPTGSMGPKIKAALDFLTTGKTVKKKVIITDSAHQVQALAGKAGTTITR